LQSAWAQAEQVKGIALTALLLAAGQVFGVSCTGLQGLCATWLISPFLCSKGISTARRVGWVPMDGGRAGDTQNGNRVSAQVSGRMPAEPEAPTPSAIHGSVSDLPPAPGSPLLAGSVMELLFRLGLEGRSFSATGHLADTEALTCWTSLNLILLIVPYVDYFHCMRPAKDLGMLD
jgi:hypothetical protein